MTTAPANLLAVRRLLLDTIKGLDPAAVGIVGDPAHRGGYHCGSDRVVTNDYSVVESPRDRAGLTLYASGLDVGLFRVQTRLGTFDNRHMTGWMIAQCRANTADSRDLREIIYSPDGKVVRRWDRLGKRSSGDDSHLWHDHYSFFRDSTKAGRDQTPLFRRYLTTIGLLEDEMTLTKEQATQLAKLDEVHELLTRWRSGMPTMADGKRTIEPVNWRIRDEAWQRSVSLALGQDPVDERAVAAELLKVLTPAAIAAALPDEVARQVADELAGRLAS
ncbi:hypothetical protein [Micromonospora wenchangensis]|uniref:hypothetical protein n=1 Tax=Micromonospora wenchangensis TaxID=1185415 RepID=UPI0038151B5C